MSYSQRSSDEEEKKQVPMALVIGAIVIAVVFVGVVAWFSLEKPTPLREDVLRGQAAPAGNAARRPAPQSGRPSVD